MLSAAGRSRPHGPCNSQLDGALKGQLAAVVKNHSDGVSRQVVFGATHISSLGRLLVIPGVSRRFGGSFPWRKEYSHRIDIVLWHYKHVVAVKPTASLWFVDVAPEMCTLGSCRCIQPASRSPGSGNMLIGVCERQSYYGNSAFVRDEGVVPARGLREMTVADSQAQQVSAPSDRQ